MCCLQMKKYFLKLSFSAKNHFAKIKYRKPIVNGIQLGIVVGNKMTTFTSIKLVQLKYNFIGIKTMSLIRKAQMT